MRYPHTATVTVTTCTVVDGEVSGTSDATSSIKGRLEFPAPNNPPRQVKNANGDWIDAKGRFFTSSAPVTGASKLTVDSVDYAIIAWVPYQTYSEIWLD